MREFDDIDLFNAWAISGTIIILVLAWLYVVPAWRDHTLPAVAAQHALIEEN